MRCFIFTFINLIFFFLCVRPWVPRTAQLCLQLHPSPPWASRPVPSFPRAEAPGACPVCRGFTRFTHSFVLEHAFPCSLPCLLSLGLPAAQDTIPVCSQSCYHHCTGLHFHTYVKKKKKISSAHERQSLPWKPVSAGRRSPPFSVGLQLLGEERELSLVPPFTHLPVLFSRSLRVSLMYWAAVPSALCVDRPVTWSQYLDTSENDRECSTERPLRKDTLALCFVSHGVQATLGSSNSRSSLNGVSFLCF